jgi:hypothetical protein
MLAIRSAKTAVLLAMLLTILAIPASAQIFMASVHGSALDPAGAAVPGVSIALTNVDTAVTHHTTTNPAGNYVILDVPPGNYTLSASANGFKTIKLSQFTLVVNQTATLDINLEVGKVQSSITVEAVGTKVQASTSELGAAVTERNVKELPLNGRNFTQLLWMTPGAGPVSTGQGSGGGYEGPVGTFVQPSFNGQINRSDLYLLDGMLNNETFMATYAVPPILESIQEFKVSSHNDQAEFGQVLGGTINVVTKSGTNDFHGNLWDFVRNTAFDSRSPFLKAVTPFVQNMFGAQATGPVIIPKIYNGKNRTFFSGAYEGYRYRSPANALYKIPTAANLQGNESDQPPLYNPYTTRPDPNNPGQFIRDPFPNNIIPNAMLDQNQLAYIAATLPSTPINTGVLNTNMIDPTELVWGQDTYNARIDENINASNTIWFRFSGSSQARDSSSGRQEVTQTTSYITKNIGVSWVHTFGATGVLQAQFGFVRLSSPLVRNFSTIPANWFEQHGYSVNLYGDFIGNPRVDPAFTVTGWFSGGGYNQFNRPSNDTQYKVNYSKTLSSHILKMGGDLASLNNELLIETGAATFATLETASPGATGTTGSAMASFLLGIPDIASRRNTLETMRWGGVLGLYFQDQWKITRNLTVNYGLRYDRNFVEPMGRPQDNNIYTGNMDFNTGTYVLQAAPQSCAVLLTAPCLPGGVLPAHVSLLTGRNTELQGPAKNFGPRLGLAYRLGPKTAVRAGAGIVFDNWSGVQQMARNFAGLWPMLGFNSLSNINPINSTPQVLIENPLPSAVIPPATPFTASAYFADPNYKNAYSEQWNLNVQHELNPSTLLSVSYVGSGSRHLDIGGEYNVAPTPGTGTPSLRYPYPYIIPSNYSRSIGSSYYDALQVLFERRSSHGVSYRLNYTWSKSIDWGSSGFFAAEGYSVQNPYNLSDDKSVSGFDLTHVFTANWVYELPFGKGRAYQAGNKVVDYVVGGWQFNGIGVLRSGQPYTLTVSGDLAGTGNTNYLRPNQVGDWHVANPQPSQWFNQAAFAAPPLYSFGNFGRNVMRSDWNRTFDFSIIRQFPLRERAHVEFRAEAFNIFNTPIFGVPGVNKTTPTTFGQVTALAAGVTPRQIQLSLKVMF